MKLIQEKKRINKADIQSKAIYELQVYKEIYNIQTIKEEKLVTKEFFEYCATKSNFVLVLLYDNEGKVYLKQNGVDTFCLPGGELFSDETIMDAVKRTVYNIDKNITISDVEPLVFVENIFTHQSEKVKHEGVIMLARSNHDKNSNISKRYYDVNETVMSKVNAFANKNILGIYKNRLTEILKQNNGEFQDEEVETNKKYKMRYKFHNEVVKRFLLTPKLKKTAKLKAIMKNKTRRCKKMIDVSCGDNSILFSLMDDTTKFVVANDISWSQTEFIPKADKIVFTNHNAITFPFKDKAFDFVYCSNTLHHIPNRENLQNLLASLLRIGKKVVIYEIEDTNVTGGLPYILNKYWYRGFLKDVGEQYLSYGEFKKVINVTYKGKASIKFENFKNIQGNYMIAEIESIEK